MPRRRLSKSYRVAVTNRRGTPLQPSGLLSNKRLAIRQCRRETKRQGHGAKGSVITGTGNALVYQCHIEHLVGERVKIVVDEL